MHQSDCALTARTPLPSKPPSSIAPVRMPLIRRCAMVPPFRALSCWVSGHLNRRDQRAADLEFWWTEAWRSHGYLMEMAANPSHSDTTNVCVRQTFNRTLDEPLMVAKGALVVAAQV